MPCEWNLVVDFPHTAPAVATCSSPHLNPPSAACFRPPLRPAQSAAIRLEEEAQLVKCWAAATLYGRGGSGGEANDKACDHRHCRGGAALFLRCCATALASAALSMRLSPIPASASCTASRAF